MDRKSGKGVTLGKDGRKRGRMKQRNGRQGEERKKLINQTLEEKSGGKRKLKEEEVRGK